MQTGSTCNAFINRNHSPRDAADDGKGGCRTDLRVQWQDGASLEEGEG